MERTRFMLAARYHRYGPPEVLQLDEVPVPEPAPAQVLVRVRASSLNGGEVGARAGKLKVITRDRFPLAVGIDFTGTVEQRGRDVSGLEVGDRVWGVLPVGAILRGVGAAAESVAVGADRVGRVPATLDLAAAAALPVATAAITALLDHGRLRAGHRVLVRGGAGGVGVAAVQLARAWGARVTALARASAVDALLGLGAHEVLDYRTTRPDDLDRYDVVLDTAGGADLGPYRARLRPGGRMIGIAPSTSRTIWSMVASTVHGEGRIRFFSGNPKRRDLDALAAYAERGDLVPVVAGLYPLADIAAAHRAFEAGGAVGKQIVEIAASTTPAPTSSWSPIS